MKIEDFSHLTSADFLKNSIENRHRCSLISPSDIDKYVDEADHIPVVKVDNLIHVYGPQGQKGTLDGEKFDSKWEAAVYCYYKYVKGIFIERNHTEWVPYTDENGKSRKFYPDFKVGGRYLEVKGIYRPSDQCKMTQHPEIEFLDGEGMKPILAELKEKLPNWQRDFIPTN